MVYIGPWQGHLERLSSSIEAASLAKQLLAWDAGERISLEVAVGFAIFLIFKNALTYSKGIFLL